MELLEYVLAGLGVGVLFGMFGAGGSAFATPVLALLGVPALLAVASPLPAMIPASFVGARRYLHSGNLDRRVARLSVIGGVPGVLIGALASNFVGGHRLLVLSGLLLLGIGVRFVLPDRAPPSGSEPRSGSCSSCSRSSSSFANSDERAHSLHPLLRDLGMEVAMNDHSSDRRDRRTTMSDAASWDERYGAAEFVWSTQPNRFLPPAIEGLTPGRALDLACGEGRNAVWLATQGWDATGVDFSATGLEKAARLAETNNVAVDWICADVTNWEPAAPFDLVVVFYLQLPERQRSAALGSAARALAPEGTLIVVAHDLTNLTDGIGGPQNRAVLYTPDDIRSDLDRSGAADLVVERAERIERPVETDTGTVMAVDCFVRAHRETP